MTSSQARYRIYIAKERSKFSAAHMTLFPDGTKERIHGHNFNVKVSLELSRFEAQNFIDFNQLKEAVLAQCALWDERLLLPAKSKLLKINKQGAELYFHLCEKHYVIPGDETILLDVENIIVETLSEQFSKAIRPVIEVLNTQKMILGFEVEISESPGQGASCYVTL